LLCVGGFYGVCFEQLSCGVSGEI